MLFSEIERLQIENSNLLFGLIMKDFSLTNYSDRIGRESNIAIMKNWGSSGKIYWGNKCGSQK